MLQLVRLDDRLIHGQVVLGWRKVLHFDKIILPLEDVGAEEWEQELLKAACPENIEVEFPTIDSICEFLPQIKEDETKTILLIGSLQTFYEFVKKEFPEKTINIGGIHFKHGRKEILPYVFLSEEERQLVKDIIKRGYCLIAQDLPENPKYDLGDILQ